MRINLHLSCPVHDSFRVQQVLGMFDMPDHPALSERFAVDLPGESEPWKIGVIVGPTGSGKTSVARKAYRRNIYSNANWPSDRAVIDCFGDHSIHAITRMLTLVGFSSPPGWIKPFSVLSNGEKFRCELAAALLGKSDFVAASPIVVFDEFTSLVDRTVARVASMAIGSAIRDGKINQRLVAVTCHDDIIPWLAPDWVLNMATQTLSREVVRRPPIRLVISRCDRSAWLQFRRHHYLSADLHKGAQCFIGTIDNREAVFAAVLPFPHPRRPGWREHRTVCLPDFQGIGIGAAMSACIASLFVATGKPFFSTTSHPAVIHHRAASPIWRMTRKPGLVSQSGRSAGPTVGMRATLSTRRMTAGFEYVGPAREKEARELGLTLTADVR